MISIHFIFYQYKKKRIYILNFIFNYLIYCFRFSNIIKYTINVTNYGPSIAKNVIVTDRLPSYYIRYINSRKRRGFALYVLISIYIGMRGY